MITPAMENHLRECVARGVAILNEKNPDWASDLSTVVLNIDDCARCILGQIYGTYGRGIEILDIPHGHYFGFNVAQSDVRSFQMPNVNAFSEQSLKVRSEVMEELKEMWIVEIHKRREEHAWEPKMEDVSGMSEHI